MAKYESSAFQHTFFSFDVFIFEIKVNEEELEVNKMGFGNKFEFSFQDDDEVVGE
jgi:hypothetical protein